MGSAGYVGQCCWVQLRAPQRSHPGKRSLRTASLVDVQRNSLQSQLRARALQCE